RSGGAHRQIDPHARTEEGAVGVRDARLGAHARAPRHPDHRRRDRNRHAEHPPQVPDGHREGGEGARHQRAQRLMLDLLAGFIQELRKAGLPVSLTENLDAMEAVKHIPMEDREAFKYALAATLVKNHAHWKAFETVFEVYFSLRRPGPGEDSDLAAELDAANLK